MNGKILSLSAQNAVLVAPLPRPIQLALATRVGARPVVSRLGIAHVVRVNVYPAVKTNATRIKAKKLVKKLEKSAKEDHVNGKKKVLMVKPRAAQQGHINVRPVKESAVIQKKAKKPAKKFRKSTASNEDAMSKLRVVKPRTNHQDRVNTRPPMDANFPGEKVKKLTKTQKLRKLRKRRRNSKGKVTLIKVVLWFQSY